MDTDTLDIQRTLGRVEQGILDIKQNMQFMRDDHAGLRAEFNKLEAGRLTRLESAFALSEAAIHTKSKNTAIIWSGIVSIITAIITAFIIHFFKI